MSTSETDRAAIRAAKLKGWVKLDEERSGVYVLRTEKKRLPPRKVSSARMRNFIQQFSADESLKQELLAIYKED